MQLSLISLALTRIYGGSAGFSPLSLFAGGEQGAWYDPSDITTMFQDSAGTTPVTADGQPVGLILDKSKGLVLGSELVTNRTFDTGTGWTLVGCTISGGNLVFNASVLNDYAGNIGSINAADVYFEITYTITSISSGSVRAQAGGRVGTIRNSAGTYVERLVSISAGQFAIVAMSAGTTATVSEVSMKVVQGNHTYQATTAKKPLYKTSGGLHWLQFDGVDDALATASIDFTGTPQVSVFGGINKVDDTARILCELSGLITTNSGAFYLVSGNDLGFATYSSMGRGTAEAGPSQVAGLQVVTGADTAVLSVAHDIPGDSSTIRRNAVAGISGIGDKGTGNFGDYPLYIGARNQTALYFNSNIYSLIVLGRTATTQEITDTEQWVADKTGVTI